MRVPVPFVAIALLTLGVSAARSASSATGGATGAPPNIVLIMADDLDARLGTLDYTPHIRQLLQQQGTTFENALVPVSLCCPSRASLLRGQYVHNHGIYTNGPPDGGFQKALDIHFEDSTIATILQSAGYRTALVGKYLNGYPLPDALTYIPPGWSEFYSPSSDAAYLGFNYSMNMNGVLASFGSEPQDYMTDVLSRTAADFIERTAPTGAPFFLFVNTYAPHAPSTPAPRHAALFPNVKAPRGGSFNELDNSDKPPLIAEQPLLTPAEIKDIDERYRKRLRSMQAVDELVDRLVATLRSEGVLDNTYLIFTSDNGYHMGQHRFRPGKYTNYEEDVRVPLIVRGPGVRGNRTLRELVSTIDLAPTLAEIGRTAMPGPAAYDGRSLLGLLKGSKVPWRQVLLIEQYPFSSQIDDQRGGLLEPDEPDQTWKSLQATSPCQSTTTPKPIFTGLRGTRFKYVEHHACDRELYDLKKDSNELKNTYAQASAAARTQWDSWLQQMATCAGDSCRAIEVTPP